MEAGSPENWSYDIYSQEAEGDECMYSAHSPFHSPIQCGTLVHGMVPATLKVDLPTSVK